MTSTLAETPNATAVATVAPITTATTATPVIETATQKPPKPSRTIRIHVNLKDQPRPVVFNYRQLYKRELKKIETHEETNVPMPSAVDSADDLFYQELLKKAESYAMDDDDAGDDGSDEETALHKKVVGNEYDFEDPFIDDSDMLLDEPHEYSAPEFDGFFVYHGPLDGHDGTEKKPTTPKRKAPAKSRALSNTTGANGTAAASTAANSTTSNSKKAGPSSQHATTTAAAATNDSKSRGKKTTDNDGDAVPSSSSNTQKPKKSTSTATGLSGTTTAAAKSTSTNNKATPSSSSATKKASTTPDQPAKKRKKLDPKDSKEDETRKTAAPASASLLATASASTTTTEDNTSEKKKKITAPTTLKPLDPEIEVLMEKLRRDVKHEDFENKAKFPLSLKPTVLEAGLFMFRKQRTIDENLVYHLMSILPYNRFTLKKFLTTKSGQMRVDELQQEIDELAIQLKQTIDRMMPEQQRLFNEKLAQAHASSSEPSNAEEEPTPKFKCNDEVRKILYDIIRTEEQSIHIANQVALHKDSEKKPEGLASDNKARKLMYQRLLSCWPEGWMHSYEMSRQYSQYKSKIQASTEKKAAAALPNTPKTNTNENKKRKRVTPQSSPSDEGLRKKQSITQDIVPPDASNFQTQLNNSKPPTNVITIDTDDDNDEEASNNWKQPSSMKIESLISGVDRQNTEKL